MALATDPVCGMRVDESKAGVQALMTQRPTRTYYFCSLQCKREFERNPHAYTTATDVVCGSEVDREGAELQELFLDHEEQRYWFCSTDCKTRFHLAPGFYIRLHGAEDSGGHRPGEHA